MMNWPEHHERTKNNPPSELLIEALGYVRCTEKALDLGDGAFKDARYLLAQGFEVTVVDKEIHPREREALASPMLHVQAVAFDEYSFKEDTFDLAVAMFTLPFIAPDAFPKILDRIKKISQI